jgi:hypothetical protein
MPSPSNFTWSKLILYSVMAPLVLIGLTYMCA